MNGVNKFRYRVVLTGIVVYLLLSYMLVGVSVNLPGELSDIFIYVVAGPIAFVLPIQDLSEPEYLGLLISYVVMSLIVGFVMWFLLRKGKKDNLLLRGLVILCIWSGTGFLGFLLHSFAT